MIWQQTSKPIRLRDSVAAKNADPPNLPIFTAVPRLIQPNHVGNKGQFCVYFSLWSAICSKSNAWTVIFPLCTNKTFVKVMTLGFCEKGVLFSVKQWSGDPPPIRFKILRQPNSVGAGQQKPYLLILNHCVLRWPNTVFLYLCVVHRYFQITGSWEVKIGKLKVQHVQLKKILFWDVLLDEVPWPWQHSW